LVAVNRTELSNSYEQSLNLTERSILTSGNTYFYSFFTMTGGLMRFFSYLESEHREKIFLKTVVLSYIHNQMMILKGQQENKTLF
ncbi:TPA: hypothetical protein ACPY5V_003612, partial [Yersinia enterocolitica]